MVTKKTDNTCYGCKNYSGEARHYGCFLRRYSYKYNDKYIKEVIPKCPCSVCLVKVVCEDRCEEYLQFGIRNCLDSEKIRTYRAMLFNLSLKNSNSKYMANEEYY